MNDHPNSRNLGLVIDNASPKSLKIEELTVAVTDTLKLPEVPA